MSAVSDREAATIMDPYAMETPRRNRSLSRVWTVFLTWFVAFLMGNIAVLASFIAVGVAMGAVMGAQGVEPSVISARVQEFVQQPLPQLLLTFLPFQLGMGAIVLLAAKQSPVAFRERLGLVQPAGRPFNSLHLAAMAGFTVSMALASLVGSSLLFGEAPKTPISNVITDGSWWAVTVLSVLVSILPAIVEEVVFRGYIQRRLLERWSPMVAIGVSTLLFALTHMDSLQHILAVVPLGIVTGLLAYRTNSVKAGMVVHLVHNATAVGFGALLRGVAPQLGDQAAGMLVIGTILALGAVGTPAVLALMWRRPSEELPGMRMESLAGVA